MRAKQVGFKRTGDSKKALKLGEGLLYKFRELMDADPKQVIHGIERIGGGTITIEASAPMMAGEKMPKVYINRLIKKVGLDQYIRNRKTYIPGKYSSTHFHWYKIYPEYWDDFPDDFRLSIWGADSVKR